MKAQGIFWIAVSPSRVGQALQNLAPNLVTRLEAPVYKIAGYAVGLPGADVRGLQVCAKRALRSDRVLRDEVPAGGDHAAKILRPRPVPFTDPDTVLSVIAARDAR